MSELIDSIQIQGYRCFEDTTVSRFGRVNLIGGLNNSGKTALLEALYIANLHTLSSPAAKSESILTVLNAREERTYIQENFSHLISKNSHSDTIKILLNNENLISIHENDFNSSFIEKNNKNTFFPKYRGSVIYIPSAFKYQGEKMLDIFSQLEFDDEKQRIFEIVKEVDPYILDIRSRYGATDIDISYKGIKGLIPLISLGDYIKKVLFIALNSWHTQPRVLLIDEIENGIHYTKHKGFWEFLFRLAINQNCQIFAATHSREMIEAYLSVNQEHGWEQEARYFEMYRHVQTDKIMAQAKPIDILEYRVEQNLPFRGEATQS